MDQDTRNKMQRLINGLVAGNIDPGYFVGSVVFLERNLAPKEGWRFSDFISEVPLKGDKR